MPIPKITIPKPNKTWLIWLLSSIGVLIIVLAGGGYYGFKHYNNRFLPKTSIGSLDISGLTYSQAEELVSSRWNKLAETGWVFNLATTSKTILPTTGSTEGSLVFAFDQEKSLETAWQKNHQGNFGQKLLSIIKSSLLGQKTIAAITINEALLEENLQTTFQPSINVSSPAKIKVTATGSYEITPEVAGQKINYTEAIKFFGQQLTNLEQKPIDLIVTTDQPVINQSAIGDLTPVIKKYLDLAPLTLTASSSDKTWPINQQTIADWLTLEMVDDQITVGPDKNLIADYLKNKLATDIDIEPQTGKFKKVNNRLEQFTPGQDGQKLQIEPSALAIEQALRSDQKTATLSIEELKNPLDENDPSSLGIVEIIGTGQSDFTGSTANRVHNIKTGANQVAGHLVAPDEEFSLVSLLGEIDASSGYKTELVIKEGKTIPEYGGGLCQVATTLFRTALASGLPITQRQNHSYRVSYYEPAGTDAAVYIPWPDLRFVNDTGKYILILSEISSRKLYFHFWGTKDGRLAEQTKPTIYNIVKPPAKKLIETDDLKPGQVKCTEKAHNGADAYFDYTVTYANGEAKNKRFKSHYVPWQEVCLVGKGATSSTSTMATTTPKTSTTTLPSANNTPTASSTSKAPEPIIILPNPTSTEAAI
ncbi:MAG TPA: VanW family protein [bacterium]|nr:VanW family protein [bacterium]